MRKLVGAAVVAVTLAVGLSGVPAHAAGPTVVKDDPNDAKRGIDMRAVKVKRLTAGIQIRTEFSHFGRNLNGMQYFFDSVKKHPGPDFGATIFREKDGDRLAGVRVYRMDGWKPTRDEITCATRYRWKIRPNGTGYFTATFGLGCMKATSTTKVRVGVRSWDYTRYRGQGERRHPVYGHDDLLKSRHYLTKRI